jgi:transcription antitermination factor NusG
MQADAWYAIQVRGRCEQSVAAQLRGKGYELFLPMVGTHRRPSSSRVAPLIPGYVFCRLGTATAPIVTTPGVVRIVSAGDRWLPIPQDEIEALKRVVQSALPATPCLDVFVGRRVRIVAGPLCGVEGVLSRAAGGDRLIVSVSILRRAVAVEVDLRSIELVASDAADSAA